METPKHVHFIGVGGIGMSGLARLFLHEGARVSGSDSAQSPNALKLQEEGAQVFFTQTAENLTDDIDLFVVTEAVKKGNPEYDAALASGKPVKGYFEALGEIANEYYLIAIAGTHGKTTTTAMLIDICEEGNLDPTAIVGSLRTKTGSNFRAGKSKYFIVEADEYYGHFLHFKPDVLIITNLEHDHPDYFKDLKQVQDTFHKLALCVPKEGAIIVNAADSGVTPVLSGVTASVIDYRMNLNLSLQLRQPGLHNRLNAACAATAAQFLGVEENVINSTLEHFAGTWRRFQYKGDCNNAPVYDDYAHHPSEIAATLSGARELYPHSKLTALFQPHTYSRTQELFDDFVSALSKADRVILVPVYAARQEEGYTKTSEDIVRALQERGVEAEHFMTKEAAALNVQEHTSKDDVILVMGAGDVTQIAHALTS